MCCSKGFLKRFVPFFLTFAVGLFIASFFVTVAAPKFQFKNRAWKKNHKQYDRQRELDIQRLREENIRLKNELLSRDSEAADFQELKFSVPLPPPVPAPPAVRLESVPYQAK
jgi:hypothetical protein